MPDVLEVAGSADVCLGQPLFLGLALLLPLWECRVHDVVHLRVVVVTLHVADLWVFDVHRSHGQRRAIWRVAPLLRFPLSSPDELVHMAAEALRLLLAGKVQTHLAVISGKCDEVRFGEVDAEVVVQLLFKHHLTLLDVPHPDEVGSQRVVLDQTGHPAASLVPDGVPVCGVQLHHGRGQGNAFPAKVVEKAVIFLRCQEYGTDVCLPTLRRMSTHY